MRIYETGDELFREVQANWDKYLKSVRIWGFIAAFLMILIGVLCFIFPVATTYFLEVVASIALLLFGGWEIVMYMRSSPVLRSGAMLVSGILNVILAIMLLLSPVETVLATFGLLFAMNLLIIGFEQLTVSGRLRAVGVVETSWVTVNGVINLIAGIILLFMPMASAVAVTFVLAMYLLFAGITLLIECINVKNATRI